jgi:hypothetical protein
MGWWLGASDLVLRVTTTDASDDLDRPPALPRAPAQMRHVPSKHGERPLLQRRPVQRGHCMTAARVWSFSEAFSTCLPEGFTGINQKGSDI